MKRNILGVLSVILILFSCQERNPGHFIDLSGVYFNNTTGMMTVTDSTDLTFVYEAEDELDVPVKVQLIGRPAGYDRSLEIRMYSENAQEGVDYILPAEPVLLQRRDRMAQGGLSQDHAGSCCAVLYDVRYSCHYAGRNGNAHSIFIRDLDLRLSFWADERLLKHLFT